MILSIKIKIMILVDIQIQMLLNYLNKNLKLIPKVQLCR
jgi:hypothetical protein